MVVHISKTELARHTRHFVDLARRGQPVFVASYGEEQVAILDATDYRLLRAVADYSGRTDTALAEADDVRGSADQPVRRTEDEVDDEAQTVWNQAVAAYLSNHISLGRLAELLGLSRWDLQERLHRLRLPLQLGPATAAEARTEIETMRAIRRGEG